MPKSGMSFSIIVFVAVESGNLKILTDTCPCQGTTDGGSYYPVSASQRMYTFFKFTPSSYFSFCRFHKYPTGIWNNSGKNIKNRPKPQPPPPLALYEHVSRIFADHSGFTNTEEESVFKIVR
jgi:hypothetical protein